MSYQSERERFIVQMEREGLPLHVTQLLLREATGLNRRAELACSSEAADRDRIPCPAAAKAGRKPGTCLCDAPNDGHQSIPRIALQDWRAEQRALRALPDGWILDLQGDPRGYVLRVIPPSYAERNKDRDRFTRDVIGVPAGPSGLRF